MDTICPVTNHPSAELRRRLQVARAKFLPIMPLTDLAKKVDRPHYTVKYWQATGNIPVDALGDLCQALDVEMDYWRI